MVIILSRMGVEPNCDAQHAHKTPEKAKKSETVGWPIVGIPNGRRHLYAMILPIDYPETPRKIESTVAGFQKS